MFQFLPFFQFDESTALTFGCLIGALFLQVVSRLDDWRWWKLKMKMRIRETLGTG